MLDQASAVSSASAEDERHPCRRTTLWEAMLSPRECCASNRLNPTFLTAALTWVSTVHAESPLEHGLCKPCDLASCLALQATPSQAGFLSSDTYFCEWGKSQSWTCSVTCSQEHLWDQLCKMFSHHSKRRHKSNSRFGQWALNFLRTSFFVFHGAGLETASATEHR